MFSKPTEIVGIEKTPQVCPLSEAYAKKHASKPIAILSCEGACLRGEVSRQAANILSHSLAPDRTVRVCLGSAFTKDAGQRNLVRNAREVIAIEGCYINCCSRMIEGVVPDLRPRVIIADQLYDFDKTLFGVDEMSEDEIRTHAREVAHRIYENLEVPVSPVSR